MNTFVVVRHPEWKDEPVIGRVLSVSGDDIEVRWYDGKYSRKWKPSRERKDGEYIPWIDVISKKYIILNFRVLEHQY